jgi:SnoaL-like domain
MLTRREEQIMTELAREDRRWLTLEDDPADPGREEIRLPEAPAPEVGGLEQLRSAFVDAFNDRDLDALLELVAEDVEFGDAGAEGRSAMAAELVAIWDRSPQVVLTRAYGDDGPCAVASRPDEDGSWTRAALVCFDGSDEVISLIEVPDDPEALANALAEEPTDDDLPEWFDWAEWDTGQESDPDGRR